KPVASHTNPPPTLYTISLHDALPISAPNPQPRDGHGLSRRSPSTLLTSSAGKVPGGAEGRRWCRGTELNCRHQPFQGCALPTELDRKSTRLNSSHEWLSYAVLCLTKK